MRRNNPPITGIASLGDSIQEHCGKQKLSVPLPFALPAFRAVVPRRWSETT